MTSPSAAPAPSLPLKLPEGFKDLVLSRTLVCKLHNLPESGDIKIDPHHTSFLANYVGHWVSNQCRAFPAKDKVECGRTEPAIYERIKGQLILQGFLVQAENQIDVPSKGFKFVWERSDLRSRIQTQKIQPDMDFTVIHLDVRRSFLIALSEAQTLGDVKTTDVAAILNWNVEYTRGLAKALHELRDIRINRTQSGLELTPSGQEFIQDSKKFDEAVGPASAAEIRQELLMATVPDLLFHCIKLTGFTKGLTKGEVGKALGAQGIISDASYTLKRLVEAGILNVCKTEPDYDDAQLFRLNKEAFLYTLRDAVFVPARTDYNLDELVEIIKPSRSAGTLKCSVNGEKASISKQDFIRYLREMGDAQFGTADFRKKLAENGISFVPVELTRALDYFADSKIIQKTRLEPKRHLGQKNGTIIFHCLPFVEEQSASTMH